MEEHRARMAAVLDDILRCVGGVPDYDGCMRCGTRTAGRDARCADCNRAWCRACAAPGSDLCATCAHWRKEELIERLGRRAFFGHILGQVLDEINNLP